MSCNFFRNMKVMDEDEWLAIHAAHGKPKVVIPPDKDQPPDYKLVTLACTCGSNLVTLADSLPEGFGSNED